MSHIFISYSKQNKEYARKLADHLIGQGFNVWIDDRIDYGDDWWRTIVRNIRAAKAFVVIMTDESDSSDWVQREVTLADNHKIPAFPLWLDGNFHESENWAIYVRTQYADVRGGKLPSEDFYWRLEKSVPRNQSAGKNVTGELPPKNEKSAPDAQGWFPSDEMFETPDAETQAKIDDFSKRHQAFLAERRERQALNPPDVSAILPQPFEWCEIAAGKVAIEYSEADHKTFDVPPFWMAKYPITNAQYQVFVDAQDGYCDPAWWGFSDEAKLWRRVNKQAGKPSFGGDEIPLTNSAWYDGVAFCHWMTSRLNLMRTAEWQIILPTEKQWQRSAQGDDGREFPWGDRFNPSLCNTRESNIRRSTPVTAYPNGASPFGVMDMSGNAWEWCLTKLVEDASSLTGAGLRVLRGGSIFYDLNFARAAYRIGVAPGARHNDFGFRVVCCSSSLISGL